MTVTRASDLAEADGDYLERCLHQVWEELTARGLVMDEPLAGGGCQCFVRNLRTAQCEMDLLVTGALVWEYLPLPGVSPDQAARLVVVLLSGASPSGGGPPPARYPGLALKDAASRMLAACGMDVRLVDVPYGDGSVCTEAMVTNPAEPGRGHVRIGDEGSIGWECLFARPGGSAAGLAPLDAAKTTLAALSGNGTAELGEPPDSRHSPECR